MNDKTDKPIYLDYSATTPIDERVVAEMIKSGEVLKAMKVGTLNAESVIQKAGAKNGLLGYGEVVLGFRVKQELAEKELRLAA